MNIEAVDVVRRRDEWQVIHVQEIVADGQTQEQRKNIVLVEDDAGLISLFSDTISFSKQWQLHIFSDGILAKENLVKMDAHLIHLIILDIGLPSLDGASLYKMLRGHSGTKHIPILVITGCYEWELQRMGLQPGYLLRKPFSIHELLAMIQALLSLESTH